MYSQQHTSYANAAAVTTNNLHSAASAAHDEFSLSDILRMPAFEELVFPEDGQRSQTIGLALPAQPVQVQDDSSDEDDDADEEEDTVVDGVVKKARKCSRWTKEEDEILRRVVPLYGGKHWKKIAEHIPGRSSIQCLHRWTKILQPGLIKGPWSLQEDAILRIWVEKEGAKKWAQCAQLISGRSGKQCRERWFNHLNPDVKKGGWTAEEDTLIFDLYKKLGTRWSEIATYFKGRTENAIKNRFYSTLRKLQTEKKRKPGKDAGLSELHLDPSSMMPGVLDEQQFIDNVISADASPQLPHLGDFVADNHSWMSTMSIVDECQLPMPQRLPSPAPLLPAMPQIQQTEPAPPQLSLAKMVELQDQVRRLEVMLTSTKAELTKLEGVSETSTPPPATAAVLSPSTTSSSSTLSLPSTSAPKKRKSVSEENVQPRKKSKTDEMISQPVPATMTKVLIPSNQPLSAEALLRLQQQLGVLTQNMLIV